VLGTRERPCSHRPCWEPENGRARTTRAGNQRTAVPVPPMQGTKEPAGLLWRTRPGTPTAGPVDGNPGVRECQAGLGRPFVTDPSSVTDRRSEFIV
jgi:hypothetical protein